MSNRLDLAPILARHQTFNNRRYPSPVINIDPVVRWMNKDIAALVTEINRLRALLAEREAVTPE